MALDDPSARCHFVCAASASQINGADIQHGGGAMIVQTQVCKRTLKIALTTSVTNNPVMCNHDSQVLMH